ncbi:carbohydrate kinase family protein [Paenibacillus thalictri]|uniref:Carbohydrate kinase family protein n=1 Tax=Paenibacillus thalictri TaxID=2527873 RepID=A0A4Q9DMC2_9BACL|nr:carbohydrate kinase family protein [Paenibacillus thalictri]TBL74640.1 carbohydrate kinase family protein [Paenibacillus thalictri]
MNGGIAVAGHICIDVIPEFPSGQSFQQLLIPGRLHQVGPLEFSTGGAVLNTGLALDRLGVPTRLIGKIGGDLLGTVCTESIRRVNSRLTDGIIVDSGGRTSYSLAISIPGEDRILLHDSGVNDTFCADDVDIDQLNGAVVFHLGYPPLLRRMHQNNGDELVALMKKVKGNGVVTSLDMSMFGPESEAAKADWSYILKNALPYVTIFAPSIEEILLMLDHKKYRETAAAITGDFRSRMNPPLLRELGDALVSMGPEVVMVKLGEEGLYMRTSERLSSCLSALIPEKHRASWQGRELWSPCFKTAVAGTTGAGDCTIAGFLCGLWKGLSLEGAVKSAVGAGACNVSQKDGISGILSWEETQAKIHSGWELLPIYQDLTDWRWDAEHRLWVGPNDRLNEALS